MRRRWDALGVYERRRAGLAAALSLLAVTITVVVLAQGGSESADPAGLVPDDAMAYVRLDIDPGGDAYSGAQAIGASLPMLSRQLVARAEMGLSAFPAAGLAPGGERPDWLGGEAAIAVFAGDPVHPSLELLAENDDEQAVGFVKTLAGAGSQRYRGVDVYSGAQGAGVVLDGFVVFGSEAEVRRVVDVSVGTSGADPLASSADFQAAMSDLPSDPFARVYLAARAVSAAATGSGLLASAVRPVLGATSPGWVGAGVTAAGESLGVNVRVQMGKPAESRGPLAQLVSFKPALPGRLSQDLLVYVGAGPARPGLEAALESLGGAGTGLAKLVLPGLGPNGLSKVIGKLLPALGRESAVAVEPGPQPPAAAASPPTIGLVTSHVDTKPARAALDALAGDLVGRLDGSTLLLAGDHAGLVGLEQPGDVLASSPGFQQAREGLAARPGLEAYFDLAGLVPLFEAAGLAENPAYASFATEVRRLEGLGVTVDAAHAIFEFRARLTLNAG